MNIQKIKISDVYKREFYIKKYGIEENDFNFYKYALEIRNISTGIVDNIVSLFDSQKVLIHNSELQNQNSVFVLSAAPKKKFNFKNTESLLEENIVNQIKSTCDNYFTFDNKQFKIKNRVFNYSSTYIMGILNVTPDSFSDGGKYYSRDKAVKRAIKMIDSGVDIIDVGGESTRPGADFVNESEEIERVVPVIQEILNLRPDTIISVDTAKSKVAAYAIDAGASLINDISAFAFDNEITDVAREYDVPYILMHMKGTPRTMQNSPFYEDPVADIYDFLNEKIEQLLNRGIKNIIIDPGIGFGKRVADNMEIINRLFEFKGLGLPILIGLSRKSFLGKILNLEVDNRDIATVIAESLSVSNGATIVRTHNTDYAMQLRKITNFSENQIEKIEVL